MRASKTSTQILKFINYANLWQFIQNQRKNATSLFLGRFWFCLVLSDRAWWGLQNCYTEFEIHYVCTFMQNLCKFIQNQWKMPRLLYSEITTDLHFRRGHIFLSIYLSINQDVFMFGLNSDLFKSPSIILLIYPLINLSVYLSIQPTARTGNCNFAIVLI